MHDTVKQPPHQPYESAMTPCNDWKPSYEIRSALCNIAEKTAQYGRPETLAPAIVRVLAPNPKHYTGAGTNSYIVGRDRVWVVDPGPNDSRHIEALVLAIDGRPVDGIFVTHSQLDHSPAANPLQQATGASIYGGNILPTEILETSTEEIDHHYHADIYVSGGDMISVDGQEWTVIATPGHYPNHKCLYNAKAQYVFCGDHILGWSSTTLVPPLGNLVDYMQSLCVLLKLPVQMAFSGHGQVINDFQGRVRALWRHRQGRHKEIHDLTDSGHAPNEIIDRLYPAIPDGLRHAALGQIAAHLAVPRDHNLLCLDPDFFVGQAAEKPIG